MPSPIRFAMPCPDAAESGRQSTGPSGDDRAPAEGPCIQAQAFDEVHAAQPFAEPLLHESPGDSCLDKDPLVRMLSDQQLRFEQGLEHQAKRILERLEEQLLHRFGDQNVRMESGLELQTTRIVECMKAVQELHLQRLREANLASGETYGSAVLAHDGQHKANGVGESVSRQASDSCDSDKSLRVMEQDDVPIRKDSVVYVLEEKLGWTYSGTEYDIPRKVKPVGVLRTMSKKVQGWGDTKARKSLLHSIDAVEGTLNVFHRVITHPLFDMTAATFIIANSLLIAAQVEWMTTNDEEPLWMMVSGHVCNLFFLIELILRIFCHGREFFTSEDKAWNAFDTFLVAYSIFDTASASHKQVFSGSSMKTLKMVRVIRIFRVFRFFRELSLMALMIAESLRSLIWAWCLIMIIMITFATCITEATSDYLKNAPQHDESDIARAAHYFGNMARTVYSLTQAMLNGKSWGEYTDTLLYVDYISVVLFLIYIVFMLVGVLNVITGVFVDNAVAAANKQREFVINQEMERTKRYIDEMSVLFDQIDQDGSGEISLAEAKYFFAQPKWSAYFAAMGIDTSDVDALFALMDQDCSGSVPIGEFVTGCMKLKGGAKRIDVATIIRYMKRLDDRFEQVLSTQPGKNSTRSKQSARKTRGKSVTGAIKSKGDVTHLIVYDQEEY